MAPALHLLTTALVTVASLPRAVLPTPSPHRRGGELEIPEGLLRYATSHPGRRRLQQQPPPTMPSSSCMTRAKFETDCHDFLLYDEDRDGMVSQDDFLALMGNLPCLASATNSLQRTSCFAAKEANQPNQAAEFHNLPIRLQLRYIVNVCAHVDDNDGDDQDCMETLFEAGMSRQKFGFLLPGTEPRDPTAKAFDAEGDVTMLCRDAFRDVVGEGFVQGCTTGAGAGTGGQQPGNPNLITPAGDSGSGSDGGGGTNESVGIGGPTGGGGGGGPQGEVTMRFIDGGDIIVSMNMRGVTPGCSPSNQQPNGCGVHIHTGTTCNDASAVGGHFWDSAAMPDDPWADIRYTSDAGGVTTSVITMRGGNGVGARDNISRAVVVHDASGGRIACGLMMIPNVVEGTVEVRSTMGLYPGADAAAIANNPGAGAGGDVGGTDGSPAAGPDGGANNIGNGQFPDRPGGPNRPSPGSGPNREEANPGGGGGGVGPGGVVAGPQGEVTMKFHDNGDIDIVLNVRGVTPDCSDANTQPNGCGVHIHSGNTCDDASAVGGHFWDQKVFPDDPWVDVRYTSNAQGESTSRITMPLGNGMRNVGRAFVIHDAAGGRIACGLLDIPLSIADTVTIKSNIGAYPGSNRENGPVGGGGGGDGGQNGGRDDDLGPQESDLGQLDGSPPSQPNVLAPQGEVTLMMRQGGGIYISLNIRGITRGCSDSNTQPNGCGVHIHSGTTCDDAGAVGGHFWDEGRIPNDPWADIRYTSDGNGAATTVIPMPNGNGYDAQANAGRAIVVHDAAGGRIACGILASETPVEALQHVTMTANLDLYPGASVIPDGGRQENPTNGNPPTDNPPNANPPNTNTGSGSANGENDVVAVPSGDVRISLPNNGDIFISMDVRGVTPDCSDSNTQPNGCGIHIHRGTNCDDASTIGGHFWDETIMADDPWANIRYTSDSRGESTSRITMLGGNGMDPLINEGRALVIHDAAGGRISCGILTNDVFDLTADARTVVAEMFPYPGSAADTLQPGIGAGNQDVSPNSNVETKSDPGDDTRSAEEESSSSLGLIIGMSCLGAFLAGMLIWYMVWRRRHVRNREQLPQSVDGEMDGGQQFSARSLLSFGGSRKTWEEEARSAQMRAKDAWDEALNEEEERIVLPEVDSDDDHEDDHDGFQDHRSDIT